jgi:methylmalonyl-CoA mutase cobalamin-binding subunit
MVGNLLQEVGYHVLMLGAEVPSGSLGEAADRHEVDVICMSSTLPGRNHETLRSIDEIRDRRPSAWAVRAVRAMRAMRAMRVRSAHCFTSVPTVTCGQWI